MPILLEIVSVDIPVLLGLELLDSECFYVDDQANRLFQRQVISKEVMPLQYVDLWWLALTKFDDHMYPNMKFPKSTFYNV